MFDFRRWESLCESVGDHVVCGTKNESNFAVVDYPAYEMETDVDVLGARVILMVFSECDGGLIVREEGDGLVKRDDISKSLG